ncbi:hypothetical protein EDC01DRAFT_77381 [Geopyxis carbonaria]|nr:hypothetical protein EDC01DRAFT_77381 [Geopyxis carbonaria]
MRTPSVLLFFALLAVLALSAVAQDNSNANNNNNNDVTTPAAAAADAKTTAAADNNAADTKTNSKADLPALTTKADPTTAKTTPTTTSQKVDATITGSGEPATSDSNLPGVTTSNPLPKITLGYSIPTVTPPPTKGAPFMQRSSLPEGTVFIAVGAGLGFFALVVLAWRGLVAWSLHRSVKRAAHDSAYADTKAMLRPPHQRGGKSSHTNNGGGGGFYAAGPGSTLSLDHLASSGRSPAPQAANSSLFFSPTSNAAGGNDRRSTYLPAGFYASGAPGNRNSTAPSNNSQTQFHNQSVSSRGGLVAGRSPPASPLMGPSGSRGNASVATERLSGMRVNDSATSLNLPPTGRAPSAYLEDLFESHRQAPGSQGQGRY